MRLFGYDILFTKHQEPAVTAPAPVIHKRRFKAAEISRLTADWIYSQQTINSEIKDSLEILRERSRDLAKNDANYRKFLAMDERNVIGTDGIVLQMRVTDLFTGKPDELANQIIESEWKKWGKKKNCTTSGRFSWIDVQRFFRRTLNVDGEVFIRLVRGFNNDYNFAIEFIASDYIDVCYSKRLENGNRIIQGIELDPYGREIAFWVTTTENYHDDYYVTRDNRMRIPASDMLHIMKPEFVGQVRGFPCAAASMLSMNMLSGYSEAELIAARTEACKMGFYVPPKGSTGEELADDIEGSGETAQLISEAVPGKFELLPEGYDLKTYNPNHPNGNHKEFYKSMMREIANGVDVSYNDFANDLESVNYSSMRSGKLSEQDKWKTEQRITIEHLCEPIFAEFFEMLMLTGVTKLPYNKKEKFHKDTWQPRAFPWVDPIKDIQANILMRQNNWKSDQQIIQDLGKDMYDVYQDIARGVELQKLLKLISEESNDENGV